MTIRANLSWKAIIGLGAWLLLGLGLSMSVAPGSLAATRQEAASKTEPASDPAAGAGSREASLGIQATSRTRDAYEIFIIQYWALGPLLRAEAVVRGQNVITVVNREFYSAWNALTNSGYRIKRPPEAIAADARRSRPFALQLDQILSEGGEKIREETVEGVEVEVFRVTDERGRRTLRVQKGADQIPIRLDAYDRTTGGEWRLDWINWIGGVTIPESYFEPPSEVAFEEFETYDDYRIREAERPLQPGRPFFPELIESLGY